MWRKKVGRVLLYIVMSLQLISLVERQIFDFLGYMWLPMLANFSNIIIVILGIFGNYQYHTAYIFIYVIWTLCWIAWNIFIGRNIFIGTSDTTSCFGTSLPIEMSFLFNNNLTKPLLFSVCFYLELGNLKRNMDLFSFGTRSYSWWILNGHGCKLMDELPANYEVNIITNSLSI